MTRNEQILAYMAKHPNATSREVARGTGMPPRVAATLMSQLRAAGKLARPSSGLGRPAPIIYEPPTPAEEMAKPANTNGSGALKGWETVIDVSLPYLASGALPPSHQWLGPGMPSAEGGGLDDVAKGLAVLQDEYQRRAHAYAEAAARIARARAALSEAS